jgi:hypothetical protein
MSLHGQNRIPVRFAWSLEFSEPQSPASKYSNNHLCCLLQQADPGTRIEFRLPTTRAGNTRPIIREENNYM